MNLPIYVLVFLIVMNTIGFALCGLDKHRARKGKWRISEATLLLVGLCGGSFGMLLGMRLFRHKTKHIKFKLLIPLECVLWGVVLIHTISALTLDRSIQYLEVSYESSKVSQELDGYLIAFVTDTHSMTSDELRVVVERINAYDPDILLLGGDFPSIGEAPARSMELLSDVNTTDGIFGVEGNHDNYQTLFAAMEQYNIVPLSNSGLKIREGLYLAGVEDLWNRSPNIAEAVQGADAEDFRVCPEICVNAE